MEKTTDFTFVDGDDTYQVSVTFTIPNARKMIDFERSRQKFAESGNDDLSMAEFTLDWLGEVIFEMSGDAQSIEELPMDWVTDVAMGVMQRGNGQTDSANS